MTKNFVQKIAGKGGIPIHYLWGKNENGLDYHWFVACPPASIALLRKHLGMTGIRIVDYGTIVAKGLGRYPSEKSRKRLQKQFGCDITY